MNVENHEAQEAGREAKEISPQKIEELYSRYTSRRAQELKKCEEIRLSEKEDPEVKKIYAEREERIKNETKNPEELMVSKTYLGAATVQNNLKKIYAILGRKLNNDGLV